MLRIDESLLGTILAYHSPKEHEIPDSGISMKLPSGGCTIKDGFPQNGNLTSLRPPSLASHGFQSKAPDPESSFIDPCMEPYLDVQGNVDTYT